MRRGRRPARALLAIMSVIASTAGAATSGAAASYAVIPATRFTSVLATEAQAAAVEVPAFALRVEPVTNAEYLAFTIAHPEWRRGSAPPVFVDQRYLVHWAAPDDPGEAAPAQSPVVDVSWFAAQAYCESEHARLPSWIEWERAAAASATVADARADPAWRQHLLDWYAQPSRTAPAAIGGAPNLYGVRDLHSLVWEWVEDFNALMVTSDSRDQGDPDRLKFCGEAALSLRDRDNYALLMRVAMLSSLKATDTTANLGFRCARSPEGIRP